MTRLTALSLVAAVFVLGACATTPQTPAQRALSDEIFNKVMEWIPAYAEERNAKAMATCIAWGGGEDGPRIIDAVWYRTGEASDIQFPAGQLMTSAMLLCDREMAGRDGCTCHELASNERNVLKVP